MVHKTKPWLVIVYIFVYAIVSPLGIAIGILLSNADDSVAVASVILQGLASGTLLYVIFFEILSKHKDGIAQFFAVVFGFFLMFGLKFIGKKITNADSFNV